MTRLVVLAFAALLIINCGRVNSADKRPETDGVAGAQWPQWRGPHRDGISNDTGLLTAWAKGGPSLLWKIGGLGRGFSSLAVAGSRIYTMGDRQDGDFVMAFNRADGKPLWSRRISDVWEPQGYAGPRCTPTVDG